MFTFAVVYVLELAVQQVRLADGADFYLISYPLSATAGYIFLLQAVRQLQALVPRCSKNDYGGQEILKTRPC